MNVGLYQKFILMHPFTLVLYVSEEMGQYKADLHSTPSYLEHVSL